MKKGLLTMAGVFLTVSLVSAGTTVPVLAEEETTLVYGSGDYTRINPAMDEHGEINILVRESTVEAQVEFRHTGMTGEIPVVRITIVHIPIAVGIENVTIPKLVFGNRLHSSE